VLGEKARKVDEVMGTLQTSVGGVASAFGVQGQAMTDVIGAVADVAKSLGSGGPLLAAVTIAGAAIAALASQFEKSAERAREAYKKLVDEAQAMSDQLAKDLESLAEIKKEKEIEKMTAGLSAEQTATVRMFVDTADAQKSLRDFEKRFGLVPANLSSVVSGVQDMTRDLSRVPQEIVFGYTGDPGFNKYADTLVKTYEQLQLKVKATTAAGQASVEAAGAGTRAEAGKDAGEAALSARFDALIKSIDENTVAMEVDAELSEKIYTAEDRATREDRGVFEVSKEQFDANLAGVDLEKADAAIQEVLDKLGSAFSAPADVIELAFVDAVDATTSDIDEMNRQFLAAGDSASALAESAIDLRSPLEQFNDALSSGIDALSSGIDSLGGAAGIAMTAIESGASGVGQALGGVTGATIGTAVAGPAGTGVGSALGSMLGGLLGDSLDKLIESLGVLTPLFDAIGVIIGSLQPILVVLGGLFVTIGDAIVALAPIVIILSRLIIATFIPSIRVFQLLLLLVPIITLVANVILVWVDYLTIGIGLLDQYFFTPLVDGAMELVNAFIMAYNSIIDLIRMIPGMGEFGTKAEYLTRDGSATVGVDDMINDVREAAALGAEEGATSGGGAGDGGGGGGGGGGEEATTEDSWGQDLANVPSGFKAMAAIYASADAESGAGMFTPMQAMEMTINIENWNSKGDSQRDWDDLRRIARNGHKGKKASSSRFSSDEKN